jgi:hypothetical protein
MPEITVRKLPNGHYTLISGERFISMLCFDEMLGVMARWGIGNDIGYGGLQTYEEQIARHPYCFVERIDGLLTHTPSDSPHQKWFFADFLYAPMKHAKIPF